MGIVDYGYDPAFRAGFARALADGAVLSTTYAHFESSVQDELTVANPFTVRSTVAHSSTPNSRRDGLAAHAGRPETRHAGMAAVLGAVIALLTLGLGAGLIAVLVAAAAAATLAFLARAHIGGYTGDVLGAAEQAAQTTVLLAVAALA